MSEELLVIKNLKTNFFTEEGIVRAVDDISLRVFAKETLGLIGESGSGKSATALSVMQLVPRPGRIVGGKILFKGENLLGKSQDAMRQIRGKGISMIFQDPMASLNPVFSVGDQICEAISVHQKMTKAQRRTLAIDLLKKVGIYDPEGRLSNYPHQLSSGMGQRVMIAIALSCNPSLIIADEPTSSLDVTIQAQVLDLMRDLKRTMGTSLLLITHDLGVVAEMCDTVAVMYAGEILEYSDVYTLFSRHAHPYTTALLDSIPSAASKRERLQEIPGNVPDMIDPPSGCRFHPRCMYTMEICKKSKPQLAEICHNHYVACFLVG